jgi:hypothetical protein
MSENKIDTLVLAVIDITFGYKLEEIETYSKIVINGVIFTTPKLETKNSDSHFRLKSRKMLCIDFFSRNNKFYVAANQIVPYNNPYYWNKFPKFRTSANICYIYKYVIIEEVQFINKLVLMIVEDNYFVSNFGISQLFN